MTITLDTVDIVMLITIWIAQTIGFILALWNWCKCSEKLHGGVKC